MNIEPMYLTILLIAGGIILLVLFFHYVPFFLWLSAKVSGVNISLVPPSHPAAGPEARGVSIFQKALCGLIRLYQKFISPGLGRNCRFSPSCSQYGIEAIRTHGCVKGLLLTAWRIARCNPLGRWGYDPVPEKGRWKNPARHLSVSALFSTRHKK